MRDFPRPKKVEVKIFGESHELKRLSFVFMQEAAPQFFERLYRNGNTVTPKEIMEAGAPAVQSLLEASFPTFKEWGELPLEYVMGLLEVIVETNDIPAIIENFTAKFQAGTKALSRTS